MLSWLFKKGIDKQFSEINNSVKSSFSNIRSDMGHVTKWIHHFKDKHEVHDGAISTHQSDIDYLKQKIDILESRVGQLEFPDPEEAVKMTWNDSDLKKWDMLTNVQQLLADLMVRLNKESSGEWHSLKKVGLEFYPEKNYSDIRSTLSHYIAVLEEFGFVERKRKGNHSFVRATRKRLPPVRIEKDVLIDSRSDNNKA